MRRTCALKSCSGRSPRRTAKNSSSMTSGSSHSWAQRRSAAPATNTTNGANHPGQHRLDAESQTHYNLHRDYNPQTGRYLQGDPIGLWGGINIYEYAAQNPLEFVVPDGRNPANCCCGSSWQTCNLGASEDSKREQKTATAISAIASNTDAS